MAHVQSAVPFMMAYRTSDRNAQSEETHMNDTDIDQLGPIDYLVVEFPADREPDGSALPLLVDLVDRGIIRILDLAFARRDLDGNVAGSTSPTSA
jgi:hypothetical protein